MCHADLDVVSYNWIRKNEDDEPAPDPDFNVVKMCRSFQAVVEWAEKNQVEDAQKKRMELKAPSDAVVGDWPY